MDALNVVRKLYESFNRRDEDALISCLALDVRWHVEGDHPMAGTFEGRDALWERQLGPLWESPMRVGVGDAVEHGEFVVAFVDQVHNFGEGERRWKTVEVFRVASGQVSERWEFISHRSDLDAFLTRGCAVAEAAALGDERAG